MQEPASIERRLIQILGIIAAIAVGGVLAILPYRLYSRDIRNASVHAHQVSSVVHAALSCPIASGTDASDMVNRFQGLADLRIRLRRLEPGEIDATSASGRGTSDLRGTDLTYLAPPILDGAERSWLAEMSFDLSAMKRESVRLIIDLVLAVVLGAAAFSAGIFLLMRHSLFLPLREMTRHIQALAEGRETPIPEFRSAEMTELADAVERACHARRESV
jgi:hypothetical protein